MKKTMLVIGALLLANDRAWSWEFPSNPDRYASIGFHSDNTWQSGNRDEVDFNNLGQPVRSNGGGEVVTTSELGADLRIPVHSNCTLEGSYGLLDTNGRFTRNSGVYKESRDLSGYRVNLGVRFYLK